MKTLIETVELVPPPGPGLVTRSPSCAGVTKNEVGTTTVIWRDETNVVGCDPCPMMSAALDGTNPEPMIVNVVAPVPTATVEGEIEEMTGAGLFTPNTSEIDAPPPGPGDTTEIR